MHEFKVSMVGKLKPRPASAPAQATEPHSVCLSLLLADGSLLEPLRAEIEAALAAQMCGTLEPGEPPPFEGAPVAVTMTGEDADLIWAAIADILERAAPLAGSEASKRYGAPGAREERVNLGPAA